MRADVSALELVIKPIKPFMSHIKEEDLVESNVILYKKLYFPTPHAANLTSTYKRKTQFDTNSNFWKSPTVSLIELLKDIIKQMLC